MPKTCIEGSCAKHVIIKDSCRKLRGDQGAIDEAMARIRAALEHAVEGWGEPNRGVQFHVALMVERPR
jgi:hypothetical protein